jgi:hypothetical protein
MTEKTVPKRQPDEYVTLVAPGGHKDIIYLTAGGPIRFFEGCARVPESVARKHLRPGWHIRP